MEKLGGIHQEIKNVQGDLYILQVSNCNLDGSQSIPLQVLVNEVVQKHGSYFIPAAGEPAELERQPPMNPNCSELDSVVQYCISNEELHKVIPRGNLVPLTPKQPVNKPVVPTHSSIVDSKIEPSKKVSKESTFDIDVKVKRFSVPSYLHIPDRTVPPRAVAVLPTALLFRRDLIYPRRKLPPHVRFGPVKGVIHKIFLAEADELICESVMGHKPVFLFNREEISVHHIDVTDKDKSNWLGLLPLGNKDTANVWLYEDNNELYCIATKTIKARVPLKLGYSKQYAEKYNIPASPVVPILDLSEAFPIVPTKCPKCKKKLASELMLQKHMSIYHKDIFKRKYRCTYCSHTFSTLYSMRRHVARFCTKKTEKLNRSKSSNESDSKSDLNSFTQNTEDNTSRLPSDESFQNYTNSLDFSTNLFDTDRIPLDISGCSRSETDFNPYSIGYKDQNSGTANEDDYNKSTEYTYSSKRTRDKAKSKVEEIAFVTCTFCEQTIAKTKRKLHIRDCPKRRFECECGQVFRSKDSLAGHIHEEHTSQLEAKVNAKPMDPTTKTPYECQECKSIFKRRGMLVNHLWRVHEKRLSEPLERPIRHYPCPDCPKIYQTARKRDLHVRRHHPGIGQVQIAPIEGGRRSCEPASCTACPRQYATRAKLLQHMRGCHPHLAPPVQKKKSQLKHQVNNDTSEEARLTEFCKRLELYRPIYKFTK